MTIFELCCRTVMTMSISYLKTKCKTVFILCVVIVGFNVHASEQKLRISIAKIGPPIGYIDSQGHASGLYAELSRVIAERIDTPYSINVVPYNRLVRLLNVGKVDCTIFFTSPKRKQSY